MFVACYTDIYAHVHILLSAYNIDVLSVLPLETSYTLKDKIVGLLFIVSFSDILHFLSV